MNRPGAAPIGGLLLAAGEGKRLGQPKALIRVGGRTLVERTAEVLTRAGCEPVVVVVGARGEEVAHTLAEAGVEVVANPDWTEGMGSSLRVGLTALAGRCGAAVLALVDQPLVGADAVQRLMRAWRQGALAAVATYGGAPRNPVVLDATLWPEVAAHARGDVGARAFLRRHPERVTSVACDDVASPADVDTPADLERIRQSLRGKEQLCS